MLFVLGAAFAQAPIALTPQSTTEVLYVAPEAGVLSKRFADDAAAKHVKFEQGTALRVLYREGSMVRVREGERYGWVPAASLTPENPKPSALPAGLEGLQLPPGMSLSPK